MKNSKGLLGFLAMVLVILALVGTKYWMDRQDAQNNPMITVKCLVGGEKMALLEDPDVVKLLEEHNIKIDAIKRGSIEMVSDPASLGNDIDCVWPSNQVALSIYKANGGQSIAAENVFNSPIVIYSWAPITNALINEGVVTAEPNPSVKDAKCDASTPADQQQGCVYYVDFAKLAQMVENGTQWSDVGMTQMYGPIKIHSTDPTKSNSGNMFAGLLANTFANGLVTQQNVEGILPRIYSFFENQGFMSESSGDIFEQYVEQGMGTYPLVVGYENQLIEFALEHKDNESLSNRLGDQVRILYPRPTVWSQHPLIARTENGKKLLDVLLGDDVQKIAWEQHGFRNGTGETGDVLSSLTVSGQISPEILSVMDMPSVGTMQRILDGLAHPETITPSASPAASGGGVPAGGNGVVHTAERSESQARSSNRRGAASGQG